MKYTSAAAAASAARNGENTEVGRVITALKACKMAKDIQAGKAIHESLSESVKKNLFVGNSLVDMYAKCGSMVEACWVFHSMTEPDTVSWNCIIQGYALNGYPDLAFNAYSRMLQLGFAENRGTYLAVLKACLKVAEKDPAGSLQRVKFIHWRVTRAGVNVELMVANTLIDLYARCGSFVEACRVFETMEQHDVVSWSCIISASVHGREADSAFVLFQQMHLEGLKGDRVTCLAVLKACDSALKVECTPHVRSKCLRMIRVVHRRAEEDDEELQVPVANLLTTVYAKCGQLLEARRLFQGMRQPSVVSWTSIILAHVEAGKCDAALEFYGELLRSGSCTPDAVCHVAALKACAGLGLADLGKALHFQVVRGGNEENVAVATSLAEMYTRCGCSEDARRVAENLVQFDVFSWTYMIIGMAETGECEAALELYTGLARDYGHRLDRVTLLAALKACAALAEKSKVQALKHCVSIYRQSKQLNIVVEEDLFLASSLVDTYAKCGSLRDAREVFKSMNRRSSVTWSCMASGCVTNGDYNAALETYVCAKEEKLLSAATFAAAWKACGSLAALAAGESIYGDALSISGLEGLSGAAVGALVDFYAKCGSMDDAQRVFDLLDSTSLECLAAWNALMVGYSCQGDSEKVLSVYEKMEEEGLPVDGIVFTVVLSAYAHAGLVDKGMSFFGRMLRSSEPPTAHHYACVIDMLGRVDRLDDAVQLLQKVEIDAAEEVVVWTALLDACCKANNTSLAEVAFSRLHFLNRASSFVQMSNMLASQT